MFMPFIHSINIYLVTAVYKGWYILALRYTKFQPVCSLDLGTRILCLRSICTLFTYDTWEKYLLCIWLCTTWSEDQLILNRNGYQNPMAVGSTKICFVYSLDWLSYQHWKLGDWSGRELYKNAYFHFLSKISKPGSLEPLCSIQL